MEGNTLNSKNLKVPAYMPSPAPITEAITNALLAVEMVQGALKQFVEAGGKVYQRSELGILKVYLYLPAHLLSVRPQVKDTDPATILLDGLPLEQVAESLKGTASKKEEVV